LNKKSKVFFSQQVVVLVDGDWNSLPTNAVEASSVNMFKNRLDDYYRSITYPVGLINGHL